MISKPVTKEWYDNCELMEKLKFTPLLVQDQFGNWKGAVLEFINMAYNYTKKNERKLISIKEWKQLFLIWENNTDEDNDCNLTEEEWIISEFGICLAITDMRKFPCVKNRRIVKTNNFVNAWKAAMTIYRPDSY